MRSRWQNVERCQLDANKEGSGSSRAFDAVEGLWQTNSTSRGRVSPVGCACLARAGGALWPLVICTILFHISRINDRRRRKGIIPRNKQQWTSLYSIPVCRRCRGYDITPESAEKRSACCSGRTPAGWSSKLRVHSEAWTPTLPLLFLGLPQNDHCPKQGGSMSYACLILHGP